ncbi:LLM class flavin-dependent oxidoreductase [Arenicella xantha]|uniref:Luciferase family oxidoreductase group 1 n=1 Tax=Arenicella xantha TaxID=644221 RepID=A0A395JQK9_9GAMM|nr:LLM class flavin-dependent oxidoreductase [Arenicella xantha]RBP51764.1 luciferase family oxidoreductase group 1 [Arenicella xantha]
MTFTLSVLDQSFTRSPDQAPQALQETIAMAQWCEQLGYERFWVSEHHAFATLAGSAPEVLIAALGAATKRIRLGSGGIMLPHYSAYKIAEVFSLLANLYPDRIDLGVGRAPGADMSTAVALATDGRPKFERFPALLEELTNYLREPVSKPLVSPKPPENLPIWLLGSSADSAQLAAQQGLPYNLALFINPQAQSELIRLYKQYFTSTRKGQRPYGTITISAFCCDTEAEAKRQQHTFDVNFFRFVSGERNASNGGALLTPEQAADYPMTPQFAGFIAQRNQNRAVGSPSQVADAIQAIAKRYAADEVMIVSNIYGFEERKRCFELIKKSI